MELQVQKISGEDSGKKVSLSDEIFGIEPNDHAIYLDVKRYQNNQRQGTHKSKERGEINYSTKKIKRQKGTGGARAGSKRSPIFRGGGRTFGPRPKDYAMKLNKKVKQLARRSALAYKAKDNNIRVVEDFKLEQPKTKEIVSIQNNLAFSEKKCLLVLFEQDKNIYLSARNLQNVKVVTLSELNTFDIMNSSIVLFSESSIENLQKKN